MHSRLRIRSTRAPLVLVILSVLVAGCATVQQTLQDLTSQRPTARVAGVRLTDIDLQSVQLVFDVDIQNPYGFDLPLLDVDYALAAYGNGFLEGTTDLQGLVPAGLHKTIGLPVRVDLVGLVRTVSSVRPGDVVPYDAELGLRVDIPGATPLRLPLQKSGELPVPRVPNMRVASLDWSEMSLTRVAGALRVDVDNTNAFPFELSTLRYDLQLGGTRVAQGATRQALQLDPAQSGTLRIPLDFAPAELGIALVNVLARERVDYAFSGSLSIDTPFGRIELPFAESGAAPSERAP